MTAIFTWCNANIVQHSSTYVNVFVTKVSICNTTRLLLVFLLFPVQIDISCFDGEIKPDVDTGFYQFCANGEWMVMPCAPGTIFDDTEYKCVAGT